MAGRTGPDALLRGRGTMDGGPPVPRGHRDVRRRSHGGARAAPDQPRLRPAPLLFEPAQAASDPEHFFDLESIEDPRTLLERATELTLAFRAAADRATEFQAMAAAQLADPGASTG